MGHYNFTFAQSFIFYLLKIDVDWQSASARKVHHKKLIEGSILKDKNNLPKHL